MNWLQPGRNEASAEPGDSKREIRRRYEHFRSVSRRLGNALMPLLSKDMMLEGGRKIGMLKGKTLVFDSEDEMSLLMDYCLYNVRRNGRNAIEQYLLDSPPEPESDEMVCLRAMQGAIYSLFIVETVEPELGVAVQDLGSNERFLLADIGLSVSAQPGLVLASRVLLFPGFAMTGGAAIPLGILRVEERADWERRLAKAHGNFDDPGSLIAECRRRGLGLRIAYAEIGDHSAAARRSPPADHRQSRPSRNDPCPCGSGKKFKHCCMNR